MALHAEVVTAIRAAVESGNWSTVDGRTIRYTEEVPFPAEHWMRSWPGVRGGFPYRDWGDTYQRHVFVTVLGRVKLIGVARSPWLERRDTTATNARTLEILADPSVAWSAP